MNGQRFRVHSRHQIKILPAWMNTDMVPDISLEQDQQREGTAVNMPGRVFCWGSQNAWFSLALRLVVTLHFERHHN